MIDDSKTWIDQKIYTLDAETNLGYDTSNSGNYGFDTISLPSSDGEVTLDSQVLATIATPQFWLGNLGISPMQIDYNGTAQASLITSLNSTNKIPSLSYGYTAGASYREWHALSLSLPILILAESNTTASLTLGGYDQSRFTPNDLSFTFSSDPGRDLVVGIQSISFSGSDVEGTPLLPTPSYAMIDSTIPDIWLPLDACTAFEKAFRITWDPIHLKYLVNETIHETLLKENASVTFQLGNSIDSGATTGIVLPYASFDLQLGPPILPNVTRYFPLRQAQNTNQITLGRSFLQEVYVMSLLT